MTPITIALVMSWSPCYAKERVTELAAGRESISALEACDLPIPPADRLWLLLHQEVLPEATLRELACRFAERALEREREAGRESDVRSWAAIAAERRWLGGELTDNGLGDAGAAARVAARAAGAAAGAAAEAAEATTQLALVKAMLVAAREEPVAAKGDEEDLP